MRSQHSIGTSALVAALWSLQLGSQQGGNSAAKLMQLLIGMVGTAVLEGRVDGHLQQVAHGLRRPHAIQRREEDLRAHLPVLQTLNLKP